MQFMERLRASLVSVVIGALLSLPAETSPATTCVALPPLKPIHCICGVVFFPSGDRISNAKVTVLQANKEIAVQQTDKDGKFSFEQLKAGKYEIRIWAEHIGSASSQVVLVHPRAKPNRELAVNMSLSGVCSSISLVDSKQFEQN
jgi:uncharacterized protein (DUF2141 family)